MSRIFLLVADPLVAGRMRHVIDATGRLKVVGWADTLARARERLPDAKASLVLGDLQLPDGWFSTLIPEIGRSVRYGRPLTLALTLSLDDTQLITAVSQGADGYFVQGQSAEKLVEAIDRTISGLADMTPTIARHLRAHFDGRPRRRVLGAAPGDDEDPLLPTPREQRVLDAVANGLLPHEIAREHHVPLNEVGTCLRTLYRKLQLDRRSASLSLQML